MTPTQSFPSNKQANYKSLIELALDLRSTWSHGTDPIWNQLDPVLWGLTQNPWAVLQTVSQQRIEDLLNNTEFILKLEHLRKLKEHPTETWFQKAHPQSPLTSVAYFSMEYMLSEALPIYSGGLGNVAADQLKTASDLGVPIVAVGLLYQQGYFRQRIRPDGSQEALYPFNDTELLPIAPLKGRNGEWLRLEILLPGFSLYLRAWKVQVGRVQLLLLDSNDVANSPIHRGITGELYGGTPEIRLQQELILGIGGWRLLEALEITPQVCHLNEGHAAFAVLERARSLMGKVENAPLTFHQALAITRVGNLFTTHTAVEAGFDRFSPEMMEHYLGVYARDRLHISFKELMALGRANPDDDHEPFNMAYLATHGSGAVNGVSRLHGEVSRRLFLTLFPRWPGDEIPIQYVTNGVHMSTWDSKAADDLWTNACGKERWNGKMSTMAQQILNVTDEALWKLRSENRADLVNYVRTQFSRQLAERGASPDLLNWAGQAFDPAVLTLGFARRFATYKRPNLLMHDPERLAKILSNKVRPVQLTMAGKAHPADFPGQKLIQEWFQFIQRPDVRPHVIFLSDYDMNIAQQLVRGVDVWINTPRRPWEASGTSGMKVLVNGGINLSELDGWWVEAYVADLGWALGDGLEHGNDPRWDASEADSLYDLLEREVVPDFYDRGDGGIPEKWVARVRQSMARLTPQFSACRTVKEYTEKHYLPAAMNYNARSGDPHFAANYVNWDRAISENWPQVRFEKLIVDTIRGQHFFCAHIVLNGLSPNDVKVSLYCNKRDQIDMKFSDAVPGSEKGHYIVLGHVSDTRPAADYTPRICPNFPGLKIPLEEKRIVWQR